jgi:hypothetical protein
MALHCEYAAIQPKPDLAEILIAASCGLVLAFTAVFLCIIPIEGSIAGARDYIVYWATGQQLAHHANPYDPVTMGVLEHAAGLPAKAQGSYYMRNPPWSLPLAWPLGFVPARLGAAPWSLEMLVCAIFAVHRLWKLIGSPRSYFHWIGYAFAPTMLCVTMGQTTLLALAGFVLFVDLHRRRPYLAGAALWLCTLKPHLVVPFGLVLMLWIALSRSYKIVLGFAVTLAASIAATWAIDHAAFSQYMQMLHTAGIDKEIVPCLTVYVANAIRPTALWLRYIPLAAGSLWALPWFWRRRREWDWLTGGSLLLLVSVAAAPYSWIYDQPLATPALLCAAFQTRIRPLVGLLAFASFAIEIELIRMLEINSAWYFWTMPFWLLWYIAAMRYAGAKDAQSDPAEEQDAQALPPLAESL